MLPFTKKEKSPKLYTSTFLCKKDVVFSFLLDFWVEFLSRSKEAVARRSRVRELLRAWTLKS